MHYRKFLPLLIITFQFGHNNFVTDEKYFMFKPLLAIAALVPSLAMGISTAQAQSWKEWSKANPTYGTTQPEAPSVPSTPASRPTTAPAPQISPVNNPATANTPNHFSTQNPLFAEKFIEGCQANGAPRSYCQCALTEIQNTYSFQEFVTIVNFATENNEIPSELMDVAFKCLPG